MANITYTVVAIIVFVSVGFAGSHALAQNEKAECLKLKAQAESYTGFFAPQWQIDMCEHHGIYLLENAHFNFIK